MWPIIECQLRQDMGFKICGKGVIQVVGLCDSLDPGRGRKTRDMSNILQRFLIMIMHGDYSVMSSFNSQVPLCVL